MHWSAWELAPQLLCCFWKGLYTNTELSHVCHQSSLIDADVLMLTQDMAAPHAQPFLQ